MILIEFKFSYKGQIKPKSRLVRWRFSPKWTDEFDLFAVKSKKANKTNLSVRFLGESMARQSAFKINWPLVTAFEALEWGWGYLNRDNIDGPDGTSNTKASCTYFGDY